MTTTNFILLVAGTPGTGKTAFSQALSSYFPPCIVESVSNIAFRLGTAKVDPSGRATSYLDNTGLAIVVADVKDKLKRSCVILETFYPRDILEADEIYYYTPVIFLLRANPRTLCSRLEGKGWPVEKIYENCLSEAFNVVAESLIDYQDMVIEVDTTNVTPKEAARIALDKLEDWKVGIEIDWLSDPDVDELVAYLSSRIDLDKYRLGI